jgi:hypothetical protein
MVEDLRAAEGGSEFGKSCDPHGLLFMNNNTRMIMSGPSDRVAWSRKRCGIVSWMFLNLREAAARSA